MSILRFNPIPGDSVGSTPARAQHQPKGGPYVEITLLFTALALIPWTINKALTPPKKPCNWDFKGFYPC